MTVINSPDGAVMVDVGAIHEHPQNPRRGNLKLIKRSLGAHGFYGALIVQRSSNSIIVGNHRYRAAVALGYTELPVIYVDVSDSKALQIMVADNKASDEAENDNESLVLILRILSDTEKIMTLFDEKETTYLLNGLIEDIPKEKEITEKDILVENKCPKCGYEW